MKSVFQSFQALAYLAASFALSFQCLTAETSCCGQWHCQKEMLYWTTHENGLEYTTKPTDVLTTDNFTERKLSHPNFHWEYGFRLKGGYTPPCSHWNYAVSWAYIANKATGLREENSSAPHFRGMFPVWSLSPDTLNGDYVSRAKMRWTLHTNLIDIDGLYTKWCWGRLKINPLVSLRCAILNQKLHVKYRGGSFYSGEDDNVARNRFLGLGPRLGATISYDLFRNISFQGLFAASALYSHFKTSHHESYLETPRFDQSNSFNRLTWCLDYQLGLQWQGRTLSCWPDVLLALSWEGHTFYNQNRMYRGERDFFKRDRHLTLSGLTLTATFCF